MISLQQVQLLEEKVSKALEYVKRINAEKEALAKEKEALEKKLEANQKRIDELEVHVLAFKEDQSRIEDGIIAALDRLSQFEQAFESSIKEEKPQRKSSPKVLETQDNKVNQEESSSSEEFFEIEDNADNDEDASSISAAETELDIF